MPEPDSSSPLEDVIIALQKAFSRVSAQSAELPPDAARALVVGKVAFDLGLKANIQQDRLLVHAEGPIELKLSGTINQDIREVAAPTTPPTSGGATPPPPPPAAPAPAGGAAASADADVSVATARDLKVRPPVKPRKRK